MIPSPIKWSATNRLGRATLLMIGLGLLLIAITAYLFLSLRERQQSVAESVREDAMWAVFQMDREASRLIETIHLAIADPTEEALDKLSLRFDLLYSRGALLRGAKLATNFSGSSELQTRATTTRQSILELADIIDSLNGDYEAMSSTLPVLLEAAQKTRMLSNDLVISTNAQLDAARVRERTHISLQYRKLGAGVVLMTLVFLCIVGLQFVQLSLISLTQRRLRHLSIRNARSAKAARSASHAKTMFLANMSHEIRTPLNGIIGATDLLKETNLSREQTKRVATIRQSGHLLLDVITDILDYSKLDRGESSYNFGPVSLPELADAVKIMMKPRSLDAGLTFEISAPNISVTSDFVRLRQVLVNLIGNAIKFTPSGGINIVLAVTDSQKLRIEVQDSGIGITKEELPKLFRDFSQIDGSASRKYEGTGLGLAISKRIVTDLGGKIGVRSSPGSGSTFWIELPVTEVAFVIEGDERNMPEASSFSTECFEGRVLLAEDNEINREVITTLLQKLGGNVTCAHNGREAIEIALAEQFDLVLMDVQMPNVDGLSATRTLREHGYHVPIVALTANAFEEDRRKCIEAGMDDFATKPITREKITGLLRKHIGVSNSQQDGSMIDEAQIVALAEDMGSEIVTDLLEQIVEQTRALLRDAQRLLDEGDMQAWDNSLHTIKGAALTLGLSGLGKGLQGLRTEKAFEVMEIGPILRLAENSVMHARKVLNSPCTSTFEDTET